MLTPADLRAMTPDDRTQLFERLAQEYYATPNTAVRLADDFDVSRPTIFRWRREKNVPWAVLFTLDRWMNGEGKASQIMNDWRNLPVDLSLCAENLGRVSRTLARLAKHASGQDA